MLPKQNLKKTDVKVKEISWPVVIVFALQMLQTSVLNSVMVFTILIWLIYLCRNISLIEFLKGKFRYYASLFIFELWAAISILWSILPSATMILVANEITYFSVAVLTALYCVHYGRSLSKSLKLASIMILILATMFALLFPGTSFADGGFRSFWHHKNYLGYVMAAISLILFLSPKIRKIDTFFGCIAIAFLIMSQSKTSLNLFLTVFLLVCFKLFIEWQTKFISMFGKQIIAIAFKILFWLLYASIVAMIFYRQEIVSYLIESIGDDLFTGRGKLWHAVLTRSSDDLLVGIGPGVFWGAGRASEIAQTSMYMVEQWIQKLTSADGGYIDLIGSLGFVGLALIFISYIESFKNLFRLNKFKDSNLIFAMLIFIILHNVTESDIYRFKDPLWYLYILLFFYLAFMQISLNPKLMGSKFHSSKDIQ